jgi:hypothetical protein
MSEDGMGCLEDHREDIMRCVNISVPELFDLQEQHSNIHLIVFSQENCRYFIDKLGRGQQCKFGRRQRCKGKP